MSSTSASVSHAFAQPESRNAAPSSAPQAVSKRALWSGRIMSGFAVLFLAFDALMKLFLVAPAVQGTTELGWPVSVIRPLGIVQALCLAAYLWPRSALLGALLWTGYLGGAIATHVRVGNPLFSHVLFPVYVALLLWGGLWLREPAPARAPAPQRLTQQALTLGAHHPAHTRTRRRDMSICQVNPYLNFDGTAEKAVKLYESALGAKVEAMMRFSDIPDAQPDSPHKNRVMHAHLKLDGQSVMISDTMPGHPFTAGSNVHVCLAYTDVKEMAKHFEALSQGGKVTMPLQDTFWGATFGMLVDAYGVSWMFNCEKKQA